MQVLDERTQVKQAIRNWVEVYGLDRTYGSDKRGRRVGAELMVLDTDTATAADVAEIIGNPAWAEMESCGECRKKTWEIVEIGEKPDYESKTAYLCGDCLRDALRMLGDA